MKLVDWLWTAFIIVATLIIVALIWFGGPLISISDYQPLEGVWTRVIIVSVILLIVFGLVTWRIVKKRRAAKALEKAMTEAAPDETDAPVLKGKMEDALATLKRASPNSSGALYDLPWYLIIGPPGAGKTTALINSGLKFPLAGDSGVRAVQGVGGTRYCDWWFTDQAVLIDTAGRYTTQDSDAKIDRKSWLAFLDMLRKNRPKQPINGVLVAISISDVLGLSAAEVNAHGDAIRKRLDELHDELKVSFPVYAIFTKMDLISGFTQYFADLDENKRQWVWGATFQTADKKANLVGQVPGEIDLLIQRIFERMPERLQDEPDLRSRAVLFGLPAQLGAISKPVSDFLNRVFEPTRYQSVATLRGFYFTSGTQEGTPFDSVIGALQKSYGVESLGLAGPMGPGKSYFLHDLLTKVVFGEAGWVSTNITAVRRAVALRAAAFTIIALATVGTLLLWWMSYARNAALIAATAAGIQAYATANDALIKTTTIKDPDIRPVYELVDALPNLPEGYDHREESTPISQTFGLSQRSRVQDASVSLYQQSLERMMRPRLILSVELQLQKNINEPIFVYEALKVYLMLGGVAPKIDKTLIVNWFVRDWEDRMFPGAPNKDARDRLRAHLQAMLDLDADGTQKIKLNGPLVDQARATLARMRVAERAYTLLKSEAHNEPIEDWVAADRGGLDMSLVFQTVNGASLDTVRVPAFYTYEGFYVGLLDHMRTIATSLQNEKWVLGASAEQDVVNQQYSTLFHDVLQLYGEDFIRAWMAALNNLQLQPLMGDKPKYVKLSAAAALTSPIRLLFESVRDETALTRDHKKAPDLVTNSRAERDAQMVLNNRLNMIGRDALDLASKSQRKAGEPPGEVPGAAIEQNMKLYLSLVDGEAGGRPIDRLLANLDKLSRDISMEANDPDQAKMLLPQIDQDVASLRANVSRLPAPVSGWMEKVAKDAAGDVSTANIQQIADSMAQEVTAPCQLAIANKYPFNPKGPDIPLADFANLFKPGGVIDRFYLTNLAPLASMAGKTWTWKPNPNLPHKLPDATLRQFQLAADIRDAFFPTGGSLPNVSLEVKMLSLNSNAQTSTLVVNGGAPIVSQSSTPASAVLQWPGAGASGASITLAPELPDQKSSIERQGAWALFRLIDAGAVTPRGQSTNVGFVVGGRDVSYQFNVNTANSPLTMPSLRQFKCPNGL